MKTLPTGKPSAAGPTSVLAGLSTALFLFSGWATAAQPFTPGSIVAYRVGSPATPAAATATPVFLDEWAPDGTLLQSINLPTAAGTAGSALLNPLTATSTGSEGLMTRSADAQCITAAGYAAAQGAGGTTGIAAGSTPRSVAFIKYDGSVDTTTSLGTLAFAGSNVRGAVTDNCGYGSTGGGRVWVSGNGTGKTNYGVWYAAKAATGGTQIYNVNAQGMAISNSQLYSSLSSSTFDTVGVGLPTAAQTSASVLAVSSAIATSNYRGVAFLSLQPGATGNDTLYLADTVNNLISKYYLSGTTWVAAGGLSTAGIAGVNTHGLMAVKLGDGKVALYFTNSKAGVIYRAIDDSGPTGSLASTTPYAAFATAANASGSTIVYYGLAPSPVQALPAAAPNAPTNALSGNVTGNAFSLTWTAPASGAAVEAYVVEVSTDPAFGTISQTLITQGSTTSATIAGLTATTSYYRIRAINGTGASTDLTSGVNVPQTITFGVPPAVSVGGTGTVPASASSGLPVTFGSLTPAVCSISGSTVAGISAGTCTITADQPGNNEYTAASEVTESFTVGGAPQSITFGPAPVLSVGATASLNATASSGLSVSYSSQSAAVCTVSGSSVTGVSAGICKVAADQAGNPNYLPAVEVTQSFTVSPASQSITFGAAPVIAVGVTGTVSATASSGLAVSFASASPATCTVSGSTVTGVTAGTCVVSASQAGNANYSAAPNVTQNVAVAAGPQTVSFTTLPNITVGSTDNLNAAATSGQPVVFSSQTSAVCTVSGTTVTGVGTGTCTIAGDQGGNANYTAAPTAQLSVIVTNPLTVFTPGSLVLSSVANVNNGGANLDTAAPIVLSQFAVDPTGASASLNGALTLPQTANGIQSAISGEFGSASEGLLQQSQNGAWLVVMGYGVAASDFNSGGAAVYGSAALGQSTSLTAANQTGTVVTTVPRVVARIGPDTSVDTSTALTGLYNQNNPRSVATIDGTAFWTSGQAASKTDPTQGVAYAQLGATTAVPVDNSTDTRVISIIDNGSGPALFVSRDQKPSSGANDFTNVGQLTDANGNIPVSATGLSIAHVVPPASPLSLGGNNASINVTAGDENGINNARANPASFVYLSPEQYFFASPTVLYVADSGQPKNGSANAAALGEGGLQKWILVNGAWTLAYDLVNGLNLVNNANATPSTPTAAGVTGLLSLTGRLVNGQVQLFATSYGLNELSPGYLYEITDNLSATSISQVASEQFTVLWSDPSGQTSFRGVAFAPGIRQVLSLGLAPAVGVGASGNLFATGGASGNPVTFASLTGNVCAVSGSTVTALAAGTCTIAVDQSGNSQYSPAAETLLNFTVGGTAQSVSFGTLPQLATGGSGVIMATATSSLPVTFSSQTTGVCTVTGSTVTALTDGLCVIAADQAGNSQYAAASEVTASFNIAGLSQAITLGATPGTVDVGSTATLTATASSGLTVTFSSTTPAICTVAGSVVTAVSAGTCTIAADQAGNASYAAAPEQTESFPIVASGGSGEGGGNNNTADSGSDGDVPLMPLWGYLLLASSMALATLRHQRARR